MAKITKNLTIGGKIYNGLITSLERNNDFYLSGVFYKVIKAEKITGENAVKVTLERKT